MFAMPSTDTSFFEQRNFSSKGSHPVSRRIEEDLKWIGR